MEFWRESIHFPQISKKTQFLIDPKNPDDLLSLILSFFRQYFINRAQRTLCFSED